MARVNPKVKSGLEILIYDSDSLPPSIRFWGEPMGVSSLEKVSRIAMKARRHYLNEKAGEETARREAEEVERKKQLEKEEESNG